MGNLPFTTTSDELATLFGRVGVVTSAQVIMDRETGRSRGFGFVEMSDEDGRKAIDELTGAAMGGRSITVNEARPRARARVAAIAAVPVATATEPTPRRNHLDRARSAARLRTGFCRASAHVRDGAGLGALHELGVLAEHA